MGFRAWSLWGSGLGVYGVQGLESIGFRVYSLQGSGLRVYISRVSSSRVCMALGIATGAESSCAISHLLQVWDRYKLGSCL